MPPARQFGSHEESAVYPGHGKHNAGRYHKQAQSERKKNCILRKYGSERERITRHAGMRALRPERGVCEGECDSATSREPDEDELAAAAPASGGIGVSRRND